MLHRNYDIRYINPINDFALHSKPVYYYAKAALRLDSQHRSPAALHNAIPLQSETTQDRAVPAHHIALLCHTTASHSLAKRHLAIASRTRAKRNLAIPLHYIPDNTSAYHSMTIVCQTIPRRDSRMHHMTSQNHYLCHTKLNLATPMRNSTMQHVTKAKHYMSILHHCRTTRDTTEPNHSLTLRDSTYAKPDFALPNHG